MNNKTPKININIKQALIKPQQITIQTNKQTFKIGNYILGKSIGNGAFGKVHIGIHLITGQKVAIKMIEKNKITPKDCQRVKRQIKILSKLLHPSIVQLYEIIEKDKYICLVMEYMSGGQLFNYIVKSKKLTEEEACRIFHQIINGIQYMHQCGFAHRDLKPENILLNNQKKIKIIDFGLSNSYKKNEKLMTSCGSPCYVAPEMIDNKSPYDPLLVDIWSTGIILYAMLCGCLPFMDNSTKGIYQKILNGHFKVPKTLSTQAKHLISRLLTVDPSNRITLQQIKSHEWWFKIPEEKSHGIITCSHRIPIDNQILQQIKLYGYNTQLTKQALRKNLHITQTSLYYILLRKFVRQGGISTYYLDSSHFDPLHLENSNLEQLQSTQMTFIISQPPSSQAAESEKQPMMIEKNMYFSPQHWFELVYKMFQNSQLLVKPTKKYHQIVVSNQKKNKRKGDSLKLLQKAYLKTQSFLVRVPKKLMINQNLTPGCSFSQKKQAQSQIKKQYIQKKQKQCETLSMDHKTQKTSISIRQKCKKSIQKSDHIKKCGEQIVKNLVFKNN